MGIPAAAVDLLLDVHRRAPLRGPVLTLGVLEIESTRALHAFAPALPRGGLVAPSTFFGAFGISSYESLDVVPDEGPTQIHDMTLPIPPKLQGRFGLVVDGGTLEHVFDARAGFENVIGLLDSAGRVVHVSPVAGWENHGFYLQQPKLFFRTYEANGFVDAAAYLIHTPRSGARPLVQRIGPEVGEFETDSKQDRTLIFFTAVKGTKSARFIVPSDSHLFGMQPKTTLSIERPGYSGPTPHAPAALSGEAWSMTALAPLNLARRSVRQILARVARHPRGRDGLAASLAALAPGERVAAAREVLWALDADERLELARRLLLEQRSDRASESVGALVAGAREVVRGVLERLAELDPERAVGERLDLALEALRDTEGRRAAAAPDVMTASLLGAAPDAIDAAYAALRRQGDQDVHTLEYALSVASNWLERLEGLGVALEGARVLELGPGYSLASGLALVSHGAARYVGADLFPLLSRSSRLYSRLRELLSERPLGARPPAPEVLLARFDAAVDVSGPEARFTPGVVEHLHPIDAASLPFPDASFDVVLSQACFEHFRDPAGAARECARVLAPGGVGLHQIDLRDHRDFTRPLEFLCFDDEAWTARFDRDPFAYTNRLRRAELVELFEAAGHRIERADVTVRCALEPGLRERLHPRFRALSEDELTAVSVMVVTRRT